jgi:hypothetical protein
MGGNFQKLGELLDEYIELPVPIGDRKDGKTKTYQIESPSGRDGLKIEAITQAAVTLVSGGEDIDTELLDDDEERNTFKLLLSEEIYEEMLADGVKWVWLRHAALTCLMWVNSGLTTAEQYWASAGDPERLARNRAERRSKQQGSSAAARSTRQRASTSGTNRNRGSKGHRQQGTRKSPGGSSSTSGI